MKINIRREGMLDWRSSHILCREVDLLQVYCCLRQVRASTCHGYGFQDEVRAFLQTQQDYYKVPLFSGDNYLEGPDFSGADCIDAYLAMRCMEPGRRVLYGLTHWVNRFRSKTFLVDVILVRYIQCCFRRIAFYLESDSDEIEPVSRLQRDLLEAMRGIRSCLGMKRVQKAWYIENYNQPDFLRHYTFEELLSEAR